MYIYGHVRKPFSRSVRLWRSAPGSLRRSLLSTLFLFVVCFTMILLFYIGLILYVF